MISIDERSIAAGGYVGLLAYVVGSVGDIDGTGLLLGSALLWLIVAVAVGGRTEPWIALGRRRLLAVPVAVPTGAALVVALDPEVVLVFDHPVRVVLALVGIMLFGGGIWIFGKNAYADHAAGESRTYWTAHPDPGRRGRVNRWSLLVGLGTVAALGGLFAVGFRIPPFYGPLWVVLSVGLAMFGTLQNTGRRLREYEACEHGLRYARDDSAVIHFVPWERFDGFRETDDAVVLERRRWLDQRMIADEVPPAAREAMRRAVGRSESRS